MASYALLGRWSRCSLGRLRPSAGAGARGVHASAAARVGKDFNVVTRADRGETEWEKLKEEVFQQYDAEQKEAARQEEERNRPRVVSFVPPSEADETVTLPVPRPPTFVENRTMPMMQSLVPPPQTPHPLVPELDAQLSTHGRGRRKSARAEVTLRPGTGRVTVNGRPLADYFPSLYTRGVMLEPIIASELTGLVDLDVRVHGGGFSGQAQAARHAIATTLVKRDPELRFLMNNTLMMRRDVRVKERKHTGKRAARKRQQWVKR